MLKVTSMTPEQIKQKREETARIANSLPEDPAEDEAKVCIGCM